MFINVCIKVLLKMISRVVKKIPIASSVNSLFGFVLGVVKSFVVVFSFCAIVMGVSKIPTFAQPIENQINSSALYTVFSDASSVVVDVFLELADAI